MYNDRQTQEVQTSAPVLPNSPIASRVRRPLIIVNNLSSILDDF